MEKCKLCDEKIESNFLNKLDGTIIKIKTDDKNEFIYVCSDCQKKHKNNLKTEIENLKN